MHELALAEGILRIICEEQEKNGFDRVLELRLGLGECSGVEPECFREFFPYAAKGTCAEGAKLSFRTIPARFVCQSCGGEIRGREICCPACGSLALRMTEGTEFRLESLNVE